MVHNEPVFLPLWLSYYSRLFAPGDIYVLDNDTTDGSTDREGFVRIPAPTCRRRCAVDARDTIQALQHELIERYDIVMVTDVDEFVAPVPQRRDRSATTSTASTRSGSTAWATSCCTSRTASRASISAARSSASATTGSTTAPTTRRRSPRRRCEWRAGFHGRADFQYNLDPDLRLVHLHRMDYEICLAAPRDAPESRAYAERDREQRWALHNQITEDAGSSSAGSTRTAASRVSGSSSRRFRPAWRETSSDAAGGSAADPALLATAAGRPRRRPAARGHVGTDQWQRVTLNAAVSHHSTRSARRTLSAAEISGDAQAGSPGGASPA